MNLPPTKHDGRVAVIIPTYNRATMLPDAVQSALAQTVVDRCDIIIVDDGSTDGTADVVRGFGDPLRYLRQHNQGAAAARNAGICATTCEFVAFLDSDDLWPADKLAAQLDVMERYPEAVFVSGRAEALHADGTRAMHHDPDIDRDKPVDLAPLLFEDNFLTTPSMLIRRTALESVGLFEPRLPQSEDYHLWTRLACVGPGVYLDRVVCTYRRDTPEQLSHDDAEFLIHQVRSRKLLKDALRHRPDCRPIWRTALGRRLAILRDRSYRQGEYLRAARFGIESLWVAPWPRPAWEWSKPLAAAWRALIHAAPPPRSGRTAHVG